MTPYTCYGCQEKLHPDEVACSKALKDGSRLDFCRHCALQMELPFDD